MVCAQPKLIPFLQDNHYGLADPQGNLVVSAQYDELKFFPECEVYVIKQNGKWGFIDEGGVPVLPNRFEEKPPPNMASASKPQAPSVNRVFYRWSSDRFKNTSPFEGCHLHQLHDHKNNQFYLYNTQTQGTLSGPYQDAEITVKEDYQLYRGNPLVTGLFKVGTLDQRINFIDTSGRVVFPFPILNGEALSTDVIAVKREDGLIALFNVQAEPLTPFHYNKVTQKGNGQFLIAEHAEKPAPYIYECDVFNENGQIIFEKTRANFYANERALFYNSDSISLVINKDELTIIEEKGVRFSAVPDNDSFIYILDRDLIGFIDYRGNTIFPPVYQFLRKLSPDRYFFQKDQQAGLMDLNRVVIWEVDSMQYENGNMLRGQITVSRKIGNSKRYGVLDTLGVWVLEPYYQRIHYHDSRAVYSVMRDSMSALLDKSGQIIFPYNPHTFYLDEYAGKVRYSQDSMQYDFDILTRELKTSRKRNVYQTTKENELYVLTDLSGNIVKRTPFTVVDMPYEHSITGPVFLGQEMEGENWFDVMNEHGKIITPAGFGVHKQFRRKAITSNGCTVVVHKEDWNSLSATSSKLRYRSGLIDENGHWKIAPTYAHMNVLDEHFIKFLHFDSLIHRIYNHSGRLLLDDDYWLAESEHSINYLSGIILVNTPADPPHYRQMISHIPQLSFFMEYNIIMREVNKHDVLYGGINLDGELVIPMEYSLILPFIHSYTTASRQNEQGKLTSYLIDKQGKEIRSYPYEMVEFLNGDSTLLRFFQDSLYGIINISGDILLSARYNYIQKQPHINAILVIEGEQNFLIMANQIHRKFPIGQSGYHTDSFRKCSEEYFIVSMKTHRHSDPKLYYVFGSKGVFYGQYKGYEVSYQDYSFLTDIPSGYLRIQDTENSKPYLVDFVNGITFKTK
jgi:hypothetical protein